MARVVVVGDALRLKQAADIAGVARRHRHHRRRRAGERDPPGRINVIDLALLPEDLPFGQLSAVAGDAAYHYIRVACELAMAGKVQAICTAPLNKEALHAAGHLFPGHTELLADLTGTARGLDDAVDPRAVKVIHVTTHIGLIDAIARSSRASSSAPSAAAHAGARRRRHRRTRRIAVCGINPHAGENGLFGHGEEATKIDPAIEARPRRRHRRARRRCPPTRSSSCAGRGDFDLVVAMYHDQGHGPVKVLGLEAGVNVTIGLPVIRTSVDHGTAFDIAGTGIADDRSMIEALRLAAEMAPRPSDA